LCKALSIHVGKDNIIFERASIDELFLDVSNHCYNFDLPAWVSAVSDGSNSSTLLSEETVMSETVIYGDAVVDWDDSEVKALRRGCEIAQGIRHAVFQELGFTMSAGVSNGKAIAKLAASYGKPNGQAVVFPQTFHQVSYY